ncbi:MAG: GNAT family N-acetyltransferase [Planctomycetota bacterium]
MTRIEGNVVIRPARPGDAQAIGRVYVETWRSTYAGILPDRVLVGLSQSRQALIWSRAIAKRGRAEFVAVAEDPADGVIGFASSGPAVEGPPGWGEVFTLYVLPDHQGEGLGRALLAALFSDFVAHGIGAALIWVLAANPFRFFYQAMGGRPVAEREESLWGTRVREVAYGWPDLVRAMGEGDPPWRE